MLALRLWSGQARFSFSRMIFLLRFLLGVRLVPCCERGTSHVQCSVGQEDKRGRYALLVSKPLHLTVQVPPPPPSLSRQPNPRIPVGFFFAEISIDGSEVVVHHTDDKEPHPLALHHVPICVTFAIFEVSCRVVSCSVV